ncbi:MAG: UDP-4-amino-4,6-dideoxy-N-acetyl-beta-L-altrosamine transaminase [Verrucomicrobiota bacterium]
MSQTGKAHIPYGRHWIDDDDIQAVVDVLRGDWLTTGPKIGEFEQAFAKFTGAKEAVAISNGTAALHASMNALGIGPGDEVIVPTMTFAASANCVVYQGGKPVFADVLENTLLIDPASVESKITPRTKAIVAVDYAGQPCDYEHLRAIASKHKLALVSDSCHSVGGAYRNQKVGTLGDLNCFSLHPVKHITTGEGGFITTNDTSLAVKMRRFRNHGIATDHRQREQQGTWFYEMLDVGYNYRLTDFQCALGLKQLAKLPAWIIRRQEIAARYAAAFKGSQAIQPLTTLPGLSHAYHLYVIRVPAGKRSQLFNDLRTRGVGVNVHYVPVHLHPFYKNQFGTRAGQCPVAEATYERILSIPMFPKMTNDDVDTVIKTLRELLG